METAQRSTRQTAAILGIKPDRLQKAIWQEKVESPQKGPAGNFMWTIPDIERAAWALGRYKLFEEWKRKIIEIKKSKTIAGKAEGRPCPPFVEKDPRYLISSHENERLYGPIQSSDPAIQALEKSIREAGLLQPLIITQDDYIISGHRRRLAAVLAKLSNVPCYVEPITHDDPQFLKLLATHNLQRVKTRTELVREAIALSNPDAPPHTQRSRSRSRKRPTK